MKKYNLLIMLTVLIAASTFTLQNKETTIALAASNYVVSTNGCSSGKLPTYLDLNSCSEDEIRQYYSSLESLSASSRSGITSLQYIKDILFNMNYFSYSQVSDIYAITERDWVNSPNLATGTYNSASNTVTDFSSSKEADSNPYIKMLYVDYSKVDKTPLLQDSGKANFDKEHVWCQSRGFKPESGDAKGPAGTDLHNLIAGDSFVNQQIHNNNPYGYVATPSKGGNLEYTSENVKGSVLHTSNKDEETVVFEPMDEYKGDVARAVFYMMARYNNVSGNDTITEFEPNLQIVNYVTSSGNAVSSSATETANMGLLSDLLSWHKLDPVSDHEIYRNDLIYRNYQGNRNPFIDFPTWVDAIWGTSSSDGTNYNPTPVGVINPATDSINDRDLSLSTRSVTLNPNGVASIAAKTKDNSNIFWTISDGNVVSIDKTTTTSGEKLNITANALGNAKLTARATVDGKDIEVSVDISVVEKKFELSEDMLMYIAIGAGAIVVIILIVVYASSSKKNKKKIEKVVKKSVKSAAKKATKSGTSSSKKSTTKKKSTTRK